MPIIAIFFVPLRPKNKRRSLQVDLCGPLRFNREINICKLFYMSKFLRSLLFAVIAMGCFDGYAQRVAIKTNAIDWLTMTPNLGLETRLSPRFSLDISVAVNPFDVSIMDVSNRNMRIQPELLYRHSHRLPRHLIRAGQRRPLFGRPAPRGAYPDLVQRI